MHKQCRSRMERGRNELSARTRSLYDLLRQHTREAQAFNLRGTQSHHGNVHSLLAHVWRDPNTPLIGHGQPHAAILPNDQIDQASERSCCRR